MNDRLLTEHEAAELMNKKVSWLRWKRSVGGGPGFVKIGVAVRYKASEISRFLTDREFANTSQYKTPIRKPRTPKVTPAQYITW